MSKANWFQLFDSASLLRATGFQTGKSHLYSKEGHFRRNSFTKGSACVDCEGSPGSLIFLNFVGGFFLSVIVCYVAAPEVARYVLPKNRQKKMGATSVRQTPRYLISTVTSFVR